MTLTNFALAALTAFLPSAALAGGVLPAFDVAEVLSRFVYAAGRVAEC